MTAESFRTADGVRLHLDDAGGAGAPVFFQHGLCGDAGQTREGFPPEAGLRRLTLEMRGHGRSEPGALSRLSIATFTDDLIAAIERLGVGPVAIGGISMGAAIALRLAVLRPDLVRGLALVRPAWVLERAPRNMRPNAEVGELIAAHSGEEARGLFEAGGTARRLALEAPDNLASLRGFFTREPLSVTSALLRAMSVDGPGIAAEAVARLRVPTLVVGHERDVVHPLAHAKALAALVPGAAMVEITPKAVDRARYVADLHAALSRFLLELPR
ncbi:alpha/beta fold hydrolase [Aureimonas sp. AU40]|uniref:alpha/beta fold hydrolase n=1 Tax=Aureimonas sp. AU40 TaxID=1637747 RepID=UPI000781E984|nr:alpha/beta hydrolase [Aureimonas sp. AU40]